MDNALKNIESILEAGLANIQSNTNHQIDEIDEHINNDRLEFAPQTLVRALWTNLDPEKHGEHVKVANNNLELFRMDTGLICQSWSATADKKIICLTEFYSDLSELFVHLQNADKNNAIPLLVEGLGMPAAIHVQGMGVSKIPDEVKESLNGLSGGNTIFNEASQLFSFGRKLKRSDFHNANISSTIGKSVEGVNMDISGGPGTIAYDSLFVNVRLNADFFGYPYAKL